MGDADPVERALADLEALVRRQEAPQDAAQSRRIPEDLADEENRLLQLDAEEKRAFEKAVAVIEDDLRFEHLKDAVERLWRFACVCALDREEDPVRRFMAENHKEPEERICYFPIEWLTIKRPVEIAGVRLLPLSDQEVPPAEAYFSLDPPVGSVAAVPAFGTRLVRMKDRARPTVERALRIVRIALRGRTRMRELQLRFRLSESYSFGGSLVGWKAGPEASVNLSLGDALVEHVRSEPVADLADPPTNDLQRRADRALTWIERATLAADPVESLLFFFFALEALLGKRSEGLKARGLAFRRAMLGVASEQGFTDPNRAFFLYERVRSAAVHGDDPPEVDPQEFGRFAWDVRMALGEYLELAAAEGLETRRAMLKHLEHHPERERLLEWLSERDAGWKEYAEDAVLAIDVEGRPATYSTDHAVPWKEAIREAVDASGVHPRPDARFKVQMDFRTPIPRTANDRWDLDNLVKPVLDALEGVLGLRAQKGAPQTNDDRVVELQASKRTVAEGETAGAGIEVWLA